MDTRRTLSLLLALPLVAFSARIAAAEVVAFGKSAPKAALGYGAPAACGAPLLPTKQWIPGHRKTVERQVWVPGKSLQVWVPPTFEQRCDPFGVFYQVQIRAGHYKTEVQPGHYEVVYETVFVPGHWQTTYKPVPKPHFGVKIGFGIGLKKGSSFGGYGHGKKHMGYGG